MAGFAERPPRGDEGGAARLAGLARADDVARARFEPERRRLPLRERPSDELRERGEIVAGLVHVPPTHPGS